MPGKNSRRQRRLRGGFLGLFGTQQNTNYPTSSYNPSSSWNLFGSTPSTGSSYYTPSSWNLFGTTPSTMGTGMGTSTMGTGMGTSTMGTGMGTSTMGTSTMGTGMGTGMGTSTPYYQRRYGGKTRGRHMKGGFKDNISATNLAAHAAPFSGPTAKPHNLVGGRTRRRGRKGGKKGSKSRHRKH
jgi:hypothetical protein